MTEAQTFPSLSRQALEEHQQIHFFLDQLARALENLVTSRVEVETMRRLSAQIEGLRERLVEHFASEEEGGLFRSMTDLVPEARAQVEQLGDQHERVLDLLETARIRARYGSTAEAEALRVDLQDFLNLLRDHEGREEELLARALERAHSA